ncbi:MAG: ribulose-bisphosphate carboxylase large subunit family protein [Gammaproteobacteria bacterium]|nr:ribulose-bisphosphate carboxylase large subunit family protein [Gammaproteobacteria bacterium]
MSTSSGPEHARVSARYWIETARPLEVAAATMAGEQSTGTFVRVAGETDALRERFAARVEQLTPLDEVDAPSLPGAWQPSGGSGRWRTAEVTLSWPLHNFGTSLPNLLATVAGNLWELNAFSGMRLLDLTLPAEFLRAYPGPRFAVSGTRALSGVHGRPLIGTIIKPSVGLSPAETAARVAELAAAGIDFIKDDELQADGPHCPFEARFGAVMHVLREHAERTGKRVLYAVNITGEIDQMLRRHERVIAGGGNCVMVSLHSVGLAGLTALRTHCQVPIHGHRNGWGLLGRSPAIGVSFPAWQKLWRLAGIDHVHVNGLDNKFCESNASVIASARECLKPMFAPPAPGCQIMPVFSSGQTALQVPGTWQALGSVDLIHACGGGIIGHPGGAAAGVRSLRQAWEAAVAGIALREYAREHRELAEALEHFGR